ncbi:MAG: hypothetical protein GX493_00035 [Firmicutes bacterium]|nr:hypothetical protein [Bacillota bacterium]
MKKLLAIFAGLVLVLGFASMTLAASESFTGSVEVTWSDGNLDDNTGAVFGASRGAVISVDYAKDFSETASAGLKVKIDYNDHNTVPDVTDDTDTVSPKGYPNFDGAGWIKVKTDFADFTAWTAIKGAAGKDITTGDIDEYPGLQVDLKAVEGLSASLILNNKQVGTDALYDFVVKGSYTMEGLTVGGGYSSNPSDADNSVTAFDVFGSYALEDLGLTVGAEYASRTARSYDPVGDATAYTYNDTGSAYLLKAGFTGIEGLTVNASYEGKDDLYGATLGSGDYPDPQDFTAADLFKAASGLEISKFAADATYQLTEQLSVNGLVQYVAAGDKNATYFKVGATFAVNEALSVSGSYASLQDKDDVVGLVAINKSVADESLLVASASYTFAPGVVGSFEYKIYDGDYKNSSYTAKITATF